MNILKMSDINVFQNKKNKQHKDDDQYKFYSCKKIMINYKCTRLNSLEDDDDMDTDSILIPINRYIPSIFDKCILKYNLTPDIIIRN